MVSVIGYLIGIFLIILLLIALFFLISGGIVFAIIFLSKVSGQENAFTEWYDDHGDKSEGQ